MSKNKTYTNLKDHSRYDTQEQDIRRCFSWIPCCRSSFWIALCKIVFGLLVGLWVILVTTMAINANYQNDQQDHIIYGMQIAISQIELVLQNMTGIPLSPPPPPPPPPPPNF